MSFKEVIVAVVAILVVGGMLFGFTSCSQNIAHENNFKNRQQSSQCLAAGGAWVGAVDSCIYSRVPASGGK